MPCNKAASGAGGVSRKSNQESKSSCAECKCNSGSSGGGALSSWSGLPNTGVSGDAGKNDGSGDLRSSKVSSGPERDRVGDIEARSAARGGMSRDTGASDSGGDGAVGWSMGTESFGEAGVNAQCMVVPSGAPKDVLLVGGFPKLPPSVLQCSESAVQSAASCGRLRVSFIEADVRCCSYAWARVPRRSASCSPCRRASNQNACSKHKSTVAHSSKRVWPAAEERRGEERRGAATKAERQARGQRRTQTEGKGRKKAEGHQIKRRNQGSTGQSTGKSRRQASATASRSKRQKDLEEGGLKEVRVKRDLEASATDRHFVDKKAKQ